MEPIRFVYDAKLRVKLTAAEVSTLRAMCERHYDATVRSLSVAGSNAVLNAAANTICNNTSVEVDFTYRQLDTLAKALEGADSAQEAQLYLRAMKMLRALGKEANEVNNEKQPDRQWWEEQLLGS